MPNCLKQPLSHIWARVLRFLPKQKLRLYRNAIFARHGKKFEDAELQKFFESQSWYKAKDDFTDNILTRIDRVNVKLLSSLEAKAK
ncbi:MAG: YARHG domain-containing protein [Deltaproteobacteria bacterium]|nr:YARHG domain-containing protein [Deltaproteobacteria bacterium]